ncbi:MAG TPA: hypothetical protein VLN72_07415, partial [Gillisia sp.]|nr:hypothetical protein [Gillisia sp.]
HFLNEAYMHCKPIGASGENGLLERTFFFNIVPKNEFAKKGVIVNEDTNKLKNDFMKAIGKHRFWNREKAENIPA